MSRAQMSLWEKVKVWSGLSNPTASARAAARGDFHRPGAQPKQADWSWAQRDLRRKWVTAAKYGNVKELEAMFASDPWLLNWPSPDRGDTDLALHRAAEHGHAQAVARLLEWGAAADRVGNGQRTPLMSAASGCVGSKWGIIDQLLGLSDANALSDKGQNALMLAAQVSALWGGAQGEAENWRKIALKTDLSQLDSEGNSALGLAAKFGQCAALRALLAMRPQMAEKSDAAGLFPWEWALKNKHWAAVETLATHSSGSQAAICRARVAQCVSEGSARREDLPRAWAACEAEALAQSVSEAVSETRSGGSAGANPGGEARAPEKTPKRPSRL